MSDYPSPAPPLGQIAITVADVAAAKEFYQNVRVMLTTPQGHGQPGNNSVLYFKVSPIVEIYERMLLAGATAERAPGLTAKMPDHDLWMGFVRDPENNLVGLMEEVRPPAAETE